MISGIRVRFRLIILVGQCQIWLILRYFKPGFQCTNKTRTVCTSALSWF